MADAWDDLGARPQAETYEQALARSIVSQTTPAMTEQEIAAKLVADRERMRGHDAYFSDNFIPVSEQVQISRTLAKRLGYHVGDNSAADDSMGEWPDND